MNRLTASSWVSEAWGGLAAMLVALPQAIAFGVVIFSALGPAAAQGALAGLVGAAALGTLAPLLGGTPRLVSAPCAPAAAVMAALAAELARASTQAPERLVLLLALAALLSGVLQCLYGLLGGGKLIKYIPYPVVTGYLSGVAVLIFLSQLPKLFGIPKAAGLWGLGSPELWRMPGLLVGATTMAAMLLAPRLTTVVPAPILGLAGGLGAYFGLGSLKPELMTLAGNPLVIGPVAAGPEALSGLAERWAGLFRLGPQDLKALFTPALTLSVLLSIDTLKTCVIVDALTRSRSDSNRELLGQGLANMASALAGGIPGAGTAGATLVNINSGGRTRLSGALAGLFALAASLLAARLVAWVPVAALAGILLVVAFRMFDRKSFRLLRRRSTALDFVVSASVILVAVSVGLIAAAGVGLGLAILLFIRDQARGSVIRRKAYGGQVFSKQRRLPEETALLERLGAQTVLCELQGNLFFGTTDQLFTELEADLKTRRHVILDMRRVQSVDYTAAHMLKQMEDYLHDRQGRLLLSNLPQSLPSGQDLQTYFGEVGLVKPKRNVSVFEGLDEALEWAEDRILEEARMERPSREEALDLRKIDLLREFEPDLIEELRAWVREEAYEPGRKIFAQGEVGDELFLIRRGSVRIMLPLASGKSHHLATFGRGDFFGEVAFLDRGKRSADAVAASQTQIYALSRERFNEMARAHSLLGLKVFARLARALAIRLRQADGELRALEE